MWAWSVLYNGHSHFALMVIPTLGLLCIFINWLYLTDGRISEARGRSPPPPGFGVWEYYRMKIWVRVRDWVFIRVRVCGFVVRAPISKILPYHCFCWSSPLLDVFFLVYYLLHSHAAPWIAALQYYADTSTNQQKSLDFKVSLVLTLVLSYVW